MAPTSRIMASSLGKIPTTSVRRLISPFTRSIGFVECSFGRCAAGKLMYARTSLSASSINSASFLTLGRSWSATCRHWVRAASASSWAKAVPMKAETTRRPCLPACASTLRMKWTRQRCHEEFRTLAMAAFSPSWASEMTSLTPRRPRLASAQKVGPEGLGLRRADRQAQHLAPAIAIDADRDDHRDRDDVAVAARLHIGRIQPDIGPLALERTVEKGHDLAVDLAAQPRYLALRDAGHAHRTDQLVDRAGRHALDIGLLDHRGQRLLGQPARLEKARKIAALAQLWDAQLNRPGAGLPITLAIPVAVGDPIGAAFAVRRTGQVLDFQLHQPMRREPDHLAQQISIGALLQERL